MGLREFRQEIILCSLRWEKPTHGAWHHSLAGIPGCVTGGRKLGNSVHPSPCSWFLMGYDQLLPAPPALAPLPWWTVSLSGEPEQTLSPLGCSSRHVITSMGKVTKTGLRRAKEAVTHEGGSRDLWHLRCPLSQKTMNYREPAGLPFLRENDWGPEPARRLQS